MPITQHLRKIALIFILSTSLSAQTAIAQNYGDPDTVLHFSTAGTVFNPAGIPNNINRFAWLTRNQMWLLLGSAVYSFLTVTNVYVTEPAQGKEFKILTAAVCGASTATLNTALGQAQLAAAITSIPKRATFDKVDLWLILSRTIMFTGVNYGCYAGLSRINANPAQNENNFAHNATGVANAKLALTPQQSRLATENARAFETNLAALRMQLDRMDNASDTIRVAGDNYHRCFQSAHTREQIKACTTSYNYEVSRSRSWYSEAEKKMKQELDEVSANVKHRTQILNLRGGGWIPTHQAGMTTDPMTIENP